MLPPGIRRQILEHALGGNIAYLINMAKLISHKHASITLFLPERIDVYNRSANDDEEGMDTLQLTRPPKIKRFSEENAIPEPNQFSTLPIALLQACHTVYSEAHPLFYTRNIFSFSSSLASL